MPSPGAYAPLVIQLIVTKCGAAFGVGGRVPGDRMQIQLLAGLHTDWIARVVASAAAVSAIALSGSGRTTS